MGKNISLILSSPSIQRAPPLLDPCCVGGDLAGGGSSGGQLQRGRGRGGQVKGKGGVGGQEKGKKGGRPLGFCGRKKRRLRCLLALHPTAHNLSLIHAPKINFWSTFFWDITGGHKGWVYSNPFPLSIGHTNWSRLLLNHLGH
jgi:hypothetical protein